MENIKDYLEHTNLSPLLTYEDMDKLVAEAKEYQFAGVCVPPYWVKKVKRDLLQTDIAVVTVIGFPFGYQRSEVKVKEIESAIRDKVDEVDVVVNLTAIKTGAYHWIKIEMAQLAKIAHENEKLFKVILETGQLTEEEIRQTAKACIDGGIDFLKTSTGFFEIGATLEHVKLLREIAPETVGIKASGGIQTLEQARTFIHAGAERIGTSAGVSIMKEVQN